MQATSISDFFEGLSALNLLSKHKGKSSIKSLQRKASMSFKFLLSLLNQVFHA